MINLINTYVEMQKKLDEEHGIIGVSTVGNMARVQVHEVDNLLKLADGYKITVSNRNDKEFKHEAHFVKQNINFFLVLNDEEYEEIIKIEGVKNE